MLCARFWHLKLNLLSIKTNPLILNGWVTAKVLKTIKKVLMSGSRNPAALCWFKYPIASNIIFRSGNWKTQRLTAVTSGPLARGIFATGPVNRTTQLSAVMVISKPVLSRIGFTCGARGTLPTVQFKFGGSETFCGGFPSRLDLVLRCCWRGRSRLSKSRRKLINLFPQSTSLAKINRWTLLLTVFRRTNWLLENLRSHKNAAIGEKVQVQLKWYNNCVTRTHSPFCLSATPEYPSGAPVQARRQYRAADC